VSKGSPSWDGCWDSVGPTLAPIWRRESRQSCLSHVGGRERQTILQAAEKDSVSDAVVVLSALGSGAKICAPLPKRKSPRKRGEIDRLTHKLANFSHSLREKVREPTLRTLGPLASRPSWSMQVASNGGEKSPSQTTSATRASPACAPSSAPESLSLSSPLSFPRPQSPSGLW
jgi:hypothetical protein